MISADNQQKKNKLDCFVLVKTLSLQNQKTKYKTLKFIVQHTCKKKGGQSHVLKNAPFFSEYDIENNKTPFIGGGHYFWEYNFEYAKVWGKMHYENSFFIVESEILITNDNEESFYLDLAGNREHLVGFVELLNEFKLLDELGSDGIDLSYIINYLREQPQEVFPFKVIRAVDYKNNEKLGIKIDFNSNMESYTILNPRIIISYKNKEDIVYFKKPFLRFVV